MFSQTPIPCPNCHRANLVCVPTQCVMPVSLKPWLTGWALNQLVWICPHAERHTHPPQHTFSKHTFGSRIVGRISNIPLAVHDTDYAPPPKYTLQYEHLTINSTLSRQSTAAKEITTVNETAYCIFWVTGHLGFCHCNTNDHTNTMSKTNLPRGRN